MPNKNVDRVQILLDTVKRGLERIETNQCKDLEDLYKTLKVMGSVCQTAAENVKNAMELNNV